MVLPETFDVIFDVFKVLSVANFNTIESPFEGHAMKYCIAYKHVCGYSHSNMPCLNLVLPNMPCLNLGQTFESWMALTAAGHSTDICD